MPQLPDVTAQRPTPVSRRGLASVDTSAEGAALIQAGNASTQVAQNFFAAEDEAKEAQDRTELAYARANFLKANVIIQAEFEDDQDYATIGERYQKKITEAMSTASAGISSPRSRALFEANTGVDVARGMATMQVLAKNKETDFHVASLNDLIQTSIDTALVATTENAMALMDNLGIAIDAEAAAGNITQTAAQKLRQAAVVNFSERWFDVQSVGVVLENIKVGKNGRPLPASRQTGPAHWLPQDKIVAIWAAAKKSKDEIVDLTATQAIADGVWAKFGGDPANETAALAFIRGNYSGKQEKGALADVKVRFEELKEANKIAQGKTDEAGMDVVLNGGGRKDVPLELWNRLSQEMQTAIEKADKNIGSPHAKIDSEDYHRVAGMSDAALAGHNMLLEIPNLTETHWQQQVDRQNDILQGRGETFKGTSIETPHQEVTSLIKELGQEKNIEISNAIRGQIQSIIAQREDELGRKLTAVERKDEYDKYRIEVLEKDFFGFLPFVDDFGVSPAGVTDVDGVPREEVVPIATELRNRGIPVTHENIKKAYDDALEVAQ